jgi:hypothetical protein
MCAHAEKVSECPLCGDRPSFSRDQVAFLEDLLINQGYMRAMFNGRASSQPEKCRECATGLAGIMELIRDMCEQ